MTLSGVLVFHASPSSCEAELSPKEFRSFPVVEKEKLSEDSYRVRVGLTSPDATLGLTVSSLLTIAYEQDGKMVGRPYTPISTRDQKGYADFVIKAYPPRTDGKAGGVAAHICGLKPGESLSMKGPWNKMAYEANKYKHIGMVAGGSGITPMLQVVLEILNNPDDRTRVTLLYANKREEDILLRSTLDALEKKHGKGKFSVAYTLDEAGFFWGGQKGFVTAAMLRAAGLPLPGDEGSKFVYACGPPPMMTSVSGSKGPKGSQGDVGGVLKELGFSADQVYKF